MKLNVLEEIVILKSEVRTIPSLRRGKKEAVKLLDE